MTLLIFSILFFIVHLGCQNDKNVIDLSRIDYSVTNDDGKFLVKFKIQKHGAIMQIKCPSCSNDLDASCSKDQLIKVSLHLFKGHLSINIPFNVSCKMGKNSRNDLKIEKIISIPYLNNIMLSWDAIAGINQYLVYCLSSLNHQYRQIPTNYISFNNLQEKTWYQICISSIDILWRTSRFRCTRVLTDFSTSGPVTNLSASSEMNSISLNWRIPSYEFDIPQAYTVYLNGPENLCLIIIIYLMPVHFIAPESCPQRKYLTWVRLKTLDINELPTNSYFKIDVIPFNSHKPFIKSSISIQTKKNQTVSVNYTTKTIPRFTTTYTTETTKSWKLPYMSSPVPRKNTSELTKDCFTDCFNEGKYYYGIRSADKDGNNCIPWSQSKQNLKLIDRISNICVAAKNEKPWCMISSRIGYCDIPQCHTVQKRTEKCVNVLNAKYTSNSITLTWSKGTGNDPTIGYITLLHNVRNYCENFHIQIINNYSLNNMGNQVKNFFLSCTAGQVNQSVSYSSQFGNLYQNSGYTIYIIPIINESHVGSIKKVTLRTEIAVPKIPKNILIKANPFNSIEISWDYSVRSKNHGSPLYYIIFIRKYYSSVISQKSVVKKSIRFKNLDYCTQYCFKITSFNEAGNSDTTEDMCQYTLAPEPNHVNIIEASSSGVDSAFLKWEYNGSYKCPIKYLVEYQDEQDNNILHAESNETTISLTNLTSNVMYTVKVRAINLLKTTNGSNMGEFSNKRQFRVGAKKWQLKFYDRRLHRSKRSPNNSSDDLNGSNVTGELMKCNSTVWACQQESMQNTLIIFISLSLFVVLMIFLILFVKYKYVCKKYFSKIKR